jgi:hypothetical protein
MSFKHLILTSQLEKKFKIKKKKILSHGYLFTCVKFHG